MSQRGYFIAWLLIVAGTGIVGGSLGPDGFRGVLVGSFGMLAAGIVHDACQRKFGGKR